MSGRNAVNDLTKDFTPARRARVDARKADLRAAMPLHELRQARAMTQRAIGAALNVNQPAVAKLERRADMYVSNLRAYIEAMGGKLKIVAEFPQGDVTITDLADPNTDQPTADLRNPGDSTSPHTTTP
ncbi:MAG: XRE family transcriptional regulator [Deltaproteobacteria bacterium]|nr:XRE family transcriptional regulator [Deltaproteobacteria bacterium]